MNSAITTDIQEVIQKNLPAAVSTVLQARLARVDELERLITSQGETIKSQNDQLTDWRAKESKYFTLQQTEQALAKREIEVTKREQATTLNEYKVLAAEAQAKAVLNVVHAVFANSKYKYFEAGNIPFANATPGGYPQTAPFNKTIETEG